MKSKIINNDQEKTYAIVLDQDEEAMSILKQFAENNGLSSSQITAIGAFKRATVAYFDWEKKIYKNIQVDEQVEVLSFIGDISSNEGEPKLHIHVVLGKSDGSTVGGHLVEAIVRPTLEVILHESPQYLHRKFNPEVGLALLDLEG